MPFLHELRPSPEADAEAGENSTNVSVIEIDLAIASQAHDTAHQHYRANEAGDSEDVPQAVALAPAPAPSFASLPSTIADNLIVGNFGASQGVDNDDG